MTHRERILATARGEMQDVIPYVPRFDLWYNANSWSGTLPEEYRDKSFDEIARTEGWALHKIIPELLKVESEEENLHRGIGLYGLKENGYRIELDSSVAVRVKRTGDEKVVEYHTPVGTVSVKEVITEEMKSAGASITWLQERAIKSVHDYRVLQYIFEHTEIVPDYGRYLQWQQEVGDDGVAVLMGTFAPSPIQHIQRDFLEATDFFYHYNDYQDEMRLLAGAIEGVYRQLLDVCAQSPAQWVLWGANYDDMITYPSYYRKDILPWLQKASSTLEAHDKLVVCHTDGENLGLMDLIYESGFHVAEAVCPYPMMRVKIEEYYQRWADKLTIFGGIPQSLLSPDTASEEDMHHYLDHFFKAVAPGSRIIAGIADTTPPHADFNRLRIIGERIAEEGRLPLEAGTFSPVSTTRLDKMSKQIDLESPREQAFTVVQQDVLNGDQDKIVTDVQQLLDKGFKPEDILNEGMLPTMEVIGGRFKTGEVFIPEVLLSARAMNAALKILEPHLAQDEKKSSGKIVIGTVHGDLHDIGKNMVVTMLKGVGYEVIDLGINIQVETFVASVKEHTPDILGLSALLTTTMPEMRKVIEALKQHGLRDTVKVMIGGAPVNETYAGQIGADGYAMDAGESVDIARALLGRTDQPS